MQTRIKTFDWLKAARIIRDRKVQNASAGLLGDESMTSGTIIRDGKIVRDSGAYLSSTWATPMLRIHHRIVDDHESTDTTILCWRYSDELSAPLQSHDWPDEAIAITMAVEECSPSTRLENIEQAARAFVNAHDRVLMPYASEARSALNVLILALAQGKETP